MNPATEGRSARSVSILHILPVLLLVGAGLLSACGSGGSSMSPMSSTPPPMSGQSCSNCGRALVTLTDAPGDFLSYIVKVDSLQLTTANGTTVQIVPNTTQVDFAQLVNLSEVVSAAEIPIGKYVSASMTVDYAGATIVVDSGSGSVPITNIINGANSMPLASPNPTQVTLTLMFDPAKPFVITPNAIANLALDFNLAASNTITPSLIAPTTVTVNPVLTASLVPDTTRQTRVRGSFVSASTTASDFLVDVRPFDNDAADGGQFTVMTTATTAYSINGTSYVGAAGLAQLATLSAGTLVVAYGAWDTTTQTFTANNVLAGSSVVGGKLDSVEGTVLSRTGMTFVVGNGWLAHTNVAGFGGPFGFSPQVNVTVGSGTMVSEPGQTGSFTAQDISVGQHVRVSGTFLKPSGNPTPDMGPSTPATLDATAGSVQLIATNVAGMVTASAANLVTLNVMSLDGRPASIFNFAGTGTSSTADAAAGAYTVTIPAALTTAPGVGAPASFTGFVTSFGQAPPDFAAASVVNYTNTLAQLRIFWSQAGVAAPFATETSSELLISQATLAASAQHVLKIGFETIDPSSLSGGLELVPDTTSSTSVFVINHRSTWSVDTYSNFGDFEAALSADLNGTTALVQLNAVGPYTAASGMMSVEVLIATVTD
ncbi:MAG TPA: DUF4382 domain-containing protein [Steroidobacteraceae bacterium]|nr:DUF4382 domain-containing protein [Steroidobacteraceae bacterium]